MRDILLLLVLFASLLTVVRFPFAGLLIWAWFSLMTPHQLAYGVYGIPLNTVIACATILSLIAHGELAKFRLDLTTALLALFAGWLAVAQAFSLDAAASAPFFDRFFKTLIFAILCAQMANTRLRIFALLWMLGIGLGYFAVKGALFTLVTFGQYRVHGLPSTMLEDNNHIGIVLAAVLPIILFLRGETQSALTRLGLLVMALTTVVAILGTQSRGAFIALVVFAGFYWLKSKRKLSMLAALALIAVPAVAFMPKAWTDRMNTIAAADQDDSFMGRVDAWIINAKLAEAHPFTGAGLRNSYNSTIAAQVDPARASRARAAHSIYFEILGGAGFVGLALYLSLLGHGFLMARRLAARPKPGAGAGAALPEWTRRYGYYAQISLAVFGVGGASTSLEMWDGYLMVIALIGATLRLDATASGVAQPRAAAIESARDWRNLRVGKLKVRSR